MSDLSMTAQEIDRLMVEAMRRGSLTFVFMNSNDPNKPPMFKVSAQVDLGNIRFTVQSEPMPAFSEALQAAMIEADAVIEKCRT